MQTFSTTNLLGCDSQTQLDLLNGSPCGLLCTLSASAPRLSGELRFTWSAMVSLSAGRHSAASLGLHGPKEAEDLPLAKTWPSSGRMLNEHEA